MPPTISRENKTEYANEKRAQELQRRGYSAPAIAGMMFAKGNNIRERHVEKMLKTKNVLLDGKL